MAQDLPVSGCNGPELPLRSPNGLKRDVWALDWQACAKYQTSAKLPKVMNPSLGYSQSPHLLESGPHGQTPEVLHPLLSSLQISGLGTCIDETGKGGDTGRQLPLQHVFQPPFSCLDVPLHTAGVDQGVVAHRVLRCAFLPSGYGMVNCPGL